MEMSGTSSDAAAAMAVVVCAACGDDKKELKKCGACDLVRYCGVDCQRKHRAQHKKACKKRAAELKDELLFKQPDSSHFGDCPLCLLPIQIYTSQDTVRYVTYDCCGKVTCDGCDYINKKREFEQRLESKCPFCRHPTPKTDAERDLLAMKRVEANDPVSIDEEGMRRMLAGDQSTAVDYWKKSAGLGHIQSHYNMSNVYANGLGGVEKDEKKELYHLEQAAIGGHSIARHNLGMSEAKNFRPDRARKHFIIGANLGCDLSLEELKNMYCFRMASKGDFAAALRAHHAAVDAMKSPQRDEAKAAKAAREAKRG